MMYLKDRYLIMNIKEYHKWFMKNLIIQTIIIADWAKWLIESELIYKNKKKSDMKQDKRTS